MARFFKKLYSSVKETIEDDFIDTNDDKKIGENVGLKFATTIKSGGALIKANGTSHNNGNTVEGTIEPELKFQDLTLKGKFQTNNMLEASVLFNDKLMKGSTVFVTGKVDDKLATSVEVGLDYLDKQYGSLNLKVISPTEFDMEKVDVYGAAVGIYNNLTAGIDGRINVSSQDVSNWNSFIEYNKGDLTFALFSKFDKKKDKKTCGFGYSQDLSPSIKGALDFSFEHKSKESSLRVGANRKFDENTSLKTRWSLKTTKEMRFGLVLKQNLNPSARVTLTCDVNTRLLHDRVSDSGHGHQFGVALSFFD